MNVTEVCLALGSNLGDRLSNLAIAIKLLGKELKIKLDDFVVASVYVSEPQNCPPDSPIFYNTVIVFNLEIQEEGLAEEEMALELLGICQKIERQIGREELSKRQKNAPRKIDIDIIYFGNLVLDSKKFSLTIPHKLCLERDFVLMPLAEIRQDFAFSNSPPVSAIVKKFPSQLVKVKSRKQFVDFFTNLHCKQ